MKQKSFYQILFQDMKNLSNNFCSTIKIKKIISNNKNNYNHRENLSKMPKAKTLWLKT